jgi:hypothetical protein
MPETPALLFINVWKARDGSHEASTFSDRLDALEEIGAEYPSLRYTGTVTVPRTGAAAMFEDWSAEAHRHAVEATDDWLERERQAHLARVL